MSTLLSQIDAALDRDDTPAAAALAQEALDAGSQEAILFNLSAWAHEEAGRFEEAEAIMRQALALYPDDPTLHLGLGVVLRKQGSLKGAVTCFEDAIKLDPQWASPWFERGQTFESGGAIADAEADYREALRREPGNPGFMAALAGVCARQGRLDEAVGLAEAALQAAPGLPAARRALAQIALERKQFAEALELLENGEWGPESEGPARLALIGDAHEGLGQFDAAYSAYLRGKQVFRELNHARLSEAGPEVLLERLEASVDAFNAADKGLWLDRPAGERGPAGGHVFLTGHPRSGTTLAENILATLPGAVAIEERPTLAGAGPEVLSSPTGAIEVAARDEEAIAALRADYWQRAGRAAGQALDGALFIDMDPFKGGRLPLIARLFPHAKYVVTIRDPRDVVWSCFHTNFAFNAGTANFTTLEHTARFYAATWSLITATLEALPLDRFELRYEDLVRDFDATTQALCGFLEVDWSEDLRRFDRTAQRRGVSTASAGQVRQGLYDGSGGWKRYEKYLATVEPILAPWIARFGYA